MKRRKAKRVKRKFSDQRIRKLVNDYPDNTTRAMSSIALDYDIPYNRVYRAVYRNPRNLQANHAMFVQTLGDVENVRKMVARGKVIEEMSYTSNGLRILIQDPNPRHKPVPFEEFKAAFDRMDMLAARGKIPRRTALAMLRAGLPLNRSELQGNPRVDPYRHHVRVKSPYRPTKWMLAEVGGMNQRCPYTRKPISVSWQKIPGGYAPVAVAGWHGDYKRYPHEGNLIRVNPSRGSGYVDKGRLMADYVISDISTALKNLKKRNHNDEMIESFNIRKRPGHPDQAIVVVKHRYYVNGARVYSAGLKTEDTIANLARIVGTKRKRIGNSDYVFNIYGINLPKSLKRMPGKLFGNRRSMKGWKIQTASVNGWADVKSSHDGGSGSYQTDYYLTRAEALREMKDFPGRKGSYRVVSATTPAQDDLYD